MLNPTRGAGNPRERNQGSPRSPGASLTVLQPCLLEGDPRCRLPGKHLVDTALPCPGSETGPM